MTTLAIDIEVDDSLLEFLTPPECPTITFPKLAKKAELCLPLGGKLQGLVDARNAVPDDCAVNFALLLQLPPFMASIECLIKVLKLIKPLMKVVNALTSGDLTGAASALKDLAPAADDVIKNCVGGIVAGVPAFVKDMLLLIGKVLHCVAETMHSIATLMGGLEIAIQTAQQSGNAELLAQLQCQKDNAQLQANMAMNNIDLVAVVLSLADAFFSLTPGAPTIVVPTFGSPSDAQSIDQISNALAQFSDALTQVADALPFPCP
jgi:hypothetical protein